MVGVCVPQELAWLYSRGVQAGRQSPAQGLELVEVEEGQIAVPTYKEKA
jgi:hypothetical protein